MGRTKRSRVKTHQTVKVAMLRGVARKAGAVLCTPCTTGSTHSFHASAASFARDSGRNVTGGARLSHPEKIEKRGVGSDCISGECVQATRTQSGRSWSTRRPHRARPFLKVGFSPRGGARHVLARCITRLDTSDVAPPLPAAAIPQRALDAIAGSGSWRLQRRGWLMLRTR
jgi:hypothetical protein